MKIYNRRDFLKLTGMSALALTLAACSDGPSVPAAPAAPAQDAQTLFAAINAYRESNSLKKLTYDKDLEDYVKLDVKCFETQGKAKITMEDYGKWLITLHSTDYAVIRGKLQAKHIEGSTCTYYGLDSTETDMTLTLLCPGDEEELKTQLAAMATSIGNTMDYIGITLTTIGGKKYWAAMLATTLG